MADESFKLALGFDGKDFAAGVGRAAKDSDKLAGALDNVVGAADDAKRSVGGLSLGAQKLRDKLDKAANRSKKTSKSLGSLGRKSKSASSGLKRASKSAKSAKSSFMSLGGVTSKLTGALGALALGGAAASAFRSFTESSLEMERAIAEVSTLVDTARVPINDIAADVRAMAAEYGINGVDAVNALYQAISAGVDANQATEFMRAAAVAATGSLSTLTESTDILTSVINAYGLEMSDASKVSDILFSTIDSGKTTMEEMNASIGQIIATSASAGVSFNEVGASLAALSKGGFKTAEALTATRALIKAIIKPTAEAKRAAAELGIDMSAAALKSKGLAGFIGDLKVKLKQAKDEGKNSAEIIQRLVGQIEGANAASALTGTQFEIFTDALKKNQNATGASEKAARKMTDTVDGRMRIALATAQTEIGKLGADFLKLVDQALESVGGIETFQAALVALRKGVIAAVMVISDEFIVFREKVRILIDSVTTGFEQFITTLKLLVAKASLAKASFIGTNEEVDALRVEISGLTEKSNELAAGLRDRLSTSLDRVKKSGDRAKKSLEDAKDSVNDLYTALDTAEQRQYFKKLNRQMAFFNSMVIGALTGPGKGTIVGGSKGKAASGGSGGNTDSVLDEYWKKREAEEKAYWDEQARRDKLARDGKLLSDEKYQSELTSRRRRFYETSIDNESQHQRALTRSIQSTRPSIRDAAKKAFVDGVRDATPSLRKSLGLAVSVKDSSLGVGQYATHKQAQDALFGAGSAGSKLVTIRQLGLGMFGRAPGFSSGGIVGGSGRGDRVPARLEPGEFVVNRKSAQRNLGLLTAINSGNNESMNTAIASPEPSQSTTNTYNNTTNQSVHLGGMQINAGAMNVDQLSNAIIAKIERRAKHGRLRI